MLFPAIEFAARAHAGQYRKGTRLPYIVHPLAVASILIEAGCPEAMVVAALLHDTVEDTAVTLDDIRGTFGDEVVRLVEAASEPDQGARWEQRKRHTMEHLHTAPADVLLLACADKLDNIRSIRRDLDLHGDVAWSRFSRPMEKQRWYYQTLAGILTARLTEEPGRGLARHLADDVARVFGEHAAGTTASGETTDVPG